MKDHEQVSGLSIYIVVRMVMSCACVFGDREKKGDRNARTKAAKRAR